MEGTSHQLSAKVAGLGKRISICTLITVTFLVLLLSFTSGSIAGAQTQINSTSSTTTTTVSTFSSTSTSSTSTTSTTSDTITSTSTGPGSTTNSTSSTSNTSIVTSSATTSSASTSAGNSTSITSTVSTLTTVTTTSTTTVGIMGVGDSSDGDYSISFTPPYWFCTNVLVTFEGPLMESGYYGDLLQFQYFQYSSSYPSVLHPIFTNSGLTVTSDTVSYWISSNEYAQLNFAYLPNIAVKVVDMTPKSNGYIPGLIHMELTNITPEGSQYCQYNPTTPIPEFQAESLMIIISAMLGSVFLRIHKRHRPTEKESKRALQFHSGLV